MIPSVIFNAAIVVLTAGAVAGHMKKAPPKVLLRFFTVLSNLLCALAALAVGIARLCGEAPQWVLVLKFVGTAAVSVTFLTVMCFLGPVVYDYKKMLTGPDLFLHLICPVLAIVSLLVWDMPAGGFWLVLLGMLPVVIYGVFYIYRVIFAPEDKRWQDFYGFNMGGKWVWSYIAMLAAAFLISLALWLVG